MNFIKKNIWTMLSLVLVVVLFSAGDASAQSDVMGIAKGKATAVFKAVKTIMFVVGGFGLVAIAFGAIAGKLNWKWFGMLATGLAVLAAASAIINYATDDGGTGRVEFVDTLKGN